MSRRDLEVLEFVARGVVTRGAMAIWAGPERAATLGREWAVVGNMSDPVINGNLPTKEFRVNMQTTYTVGAKRSTPHPRLLTTQSSSAQPQET